MSLKNTFRRAVAAVSLLLLPAGLAAQTSSINAFSPYTMYGIGEINTPGTLPMRSMGGAGVAMRNPGMMNVLNPAAYSAVPQKSFLLSFGLEGQNYYNSQSVDGAKKKSAYNTFNFHDIAVLLPLTRHLGLGVSLMPYSSVGYRTEFFREFDSADPVWGNVGPVQYTYQGEGDVTEVKLGMGWEVAKHFSIGLAAQYYWGKIDRTYVAAFSSITGSGSYNSIVGQSAYTVSRFKGQVGLQWDAIMNARRVLSFGATFDIGGDLRPKRTERVYTTDPDNTAAVDLHDDLELVLPRQLVAGFYYQTPKWTVGADYVYQNWAGSNSSSLSSGIAAGGGRFDVAYADTHTVKAGVEFIPNRYDVRRFLRRCAYRAGVRYGDYYQTFGGQRLQQYAVTLGVGIPVRFLGSSSIDVGLEYGDRGFNVAERIGLVRQRYFKIAVGFALFAGSENGEYWFVRPKYD